jgi:hypothetical protein
VREYMGGERGGAGDCGDAYRGTADVRRVLIPSNSPKTDDISEIFSTVTLVHSEAAVPRFKLR